MATGTVATRATLTHGPICKTDEFGHHHEPEIEVRLSIADATIVANKLQQQGATITQLFAERLFELVALANEAQGKRRETWLAEHGHPAEIV